MFANIWSTEIFFCSLLCSIVSPKAPWNSRLYVMGIWYHIW